MPQPLPEPLRDRPFSTGEAVQLGVTEKRLRGRDLSTPFWGVRSSMVSSVKEVAQAFAARMQDGAFFSHQTAAVLHGIPLPIGADHGPLHVSVVTERRGPTGAGVIGHHIHIGRADLTRVDGLPATTLERTVCDLSRSLDDEALLAAIDNVLWWRRPLSRRATVDSLDATLRRYRGRRGRARLVEMMAFASDRADAPPESAFRLRFARAGLPRAEPNRRVYSGSGAFIAMPDLQFRAFRMAFDYEGDHHRTDRRQWRKDLARVPRLQDAGWHHTRLSGDDLTDSRDVIARARRNLLARGWCPPR
ncbi:hypothetical protein M2152_001940 [Microbacteriaceae bacterium SG_E_30_P1]|uniref:DUF559 domain-containing protein n=1 Tax=Antiquaquibacter oligotrophicus TaxID=2880260 RepID=A0ABT6KP33_9MICO|nr:hypothetical protein [Antiquaquibacter oligotrophicus]MDH6181758.1 hypothetical protein [Antiquaquibacter oligotrophicus]UDF12561.1 hypothetical protein LH407_10400 [Antiquaquibacter oligotrophicus]